MRSCEFVFCADVLGRGLMHGLRQFDCDFDLWVCDIPEAVDDDLGERCCAVR
jgi:hypothetical protein